MVRVSTDEIVYVRAQGNYSEMMLTNGQKARILPFQLHFFEETFQRMRSGKNFVRLGRSLIVNKRYIFVINLKTQLLHFSGQQLKQEITPINVSREALKQLKDQLEMEKGDDYD